MSVLVSQSTTSVAARSSARTRRSSPGSSVPRFRGPRPSPARRCSFGVRLSTPQPSPASLSPGPVAYAIPRGLTRRGSDCSPAFSLRGKLQGGAAHAQAQNPQAQAKGDDGPGPAAYYPRDARRTQKGFSLGTRARYDPFVKQPDPCSYTLPSSFDAALAPRRLPTFSARPRSMFDVRRDGPDPAQYEVTDASRYKRAAPRYSFGRRGPLTWGPLTPTPRTPTVSANSSNTPHNLINNVLLKKAAS